MPTQYIDKINLSGNREYEMRDSIAEMKDVSLSSLASGHVLTFNGTSWVNQAGGGGGGSSTLAGLSDTTISNPSPTQVLQYINGSWRNRFIAQGMTRIEFPILLSSRDISEIDFSGDGIQDFDVADYYVEIDGTISPAPIQVNALPNECVNLYLKNINSANAQGVIVRFLFSNEFADYAVYDDGNINYNSDYVEVMIPRNKVIEASIKRYMNLNGEPIIAIAYSDPLTIQAI